MLTRALVCPVLVGREEELQQLVKRRLAASRGHGALVLISGDAGIGKSRLLRSFRQTLRGGRAACVVGLNREFGNPPYGAVMEALRGLVPDPAFSQAQSRAEQLAGLVDRVAAACAQRSVVMMLEDLHWADDGTLLFLQHLLPLLSSLRLLIVATYRADDVHRLELLELHLARLIRNRSTHRIALEPLGAAGMRRLLRLALGQSRQLPATVLEDIVERSDGNPFFAEELLKHALDSRGSDLPGHLPLTVRATVLERVAGLEPDARELLSRAAVLGRRFEAGFLSDLCGTDSGKVLETLRRLRNLQLIDELAEEPPAFAFRHAMTREAIYGELLTAEARPLHARILGALEDRAAEVSDLGYHSWAAGNAQKCLAYNERAGDEAHALHVYGQAVRCYDRAISRGAPDEARARILVKSAQSCASDGKAAQAVDRYGLAAEAYRACGQTDRLPDLYLAMSAQSRAGGDNERGVQILENAIAATEDLTPGERARLGISLACLHLDRGEVQPAKALIARSHAAAGTPSYQNAVQYAELVAGEVSAFRAAADVNIALHASLGDFERLRVRFNRAFGLTILGCDDDALAEFDAILPEFQQTRLASLEVLAYANSALIHGRAGRLAAGKIAIEKAAIEPEQTTTGPIALAAAALTIGFALWDTELVSRMFSPELLEAAFASRINSTLGRIAGPYARWLSGSGDTEGAKAILRRAMNCINAPFGATETLLAAAELGDESTRAAAFRYIDSLDRMSAATIYAATAHHLRAFRAFHENDEAAARRHSSDALPLYVQLGWAMHQAACVQLCGDSKRASVHYRRLRAAGPLRGIQALSEREREIASLVARGTVNKRIAERLAVNQRTVEKHLTSIYGKLGLRNRSELAAYVTQNKSPAG